MSKTPFRMPPPKVAAVQLDQWVAIGGSADTTASTAAATSGPGRKLARLTIDLPPELHAKFKAGCAMRGTRMIDEVRGFIEQWIQKHGNL